MSSLTVEDQVQDSLETLEGEIKELKGEKKALREEKKALKEEKKELKEKIEKCKTDDEFSHISYFQRQGALNLLHNRLFVLESRLARLEAERKDLVSSQQRK